MLQKALIISALVVGTASLASAQEFLDFDDIPGLGNQPAIEVDLDAGIINFAREAARLTDPAAAEALAGLEALHVRIFHNLADAARVVEYLDANADRLARDNWQQVVRLQEQGDVRVYVQADGEVVTGLSAVVINDGEAVFASVTGSIDPQKLAQIVAASGAGNVLGSLASISPGN